MISLSSGPVNERANLLDQKGVCSDLTPEHHGIALFRLDRAF
jgi:hypothetical protein